MIATLGMFDGMHLGHIALLRQLIFWTRGRGGFCAVVTFDRHPRSVIGGGAPNQITSLEQKLYIFEHLGIDGTAVVTFDSDTAAMPPEDFVRKVLVGRLGTRAVLLGFNNRFGKGGSGDYALLCKMAPELGLTVRQGTSLWSGGAPISSTEIRTAVSRGDMNSAERMLGRKFSFWGVVMPGKQVGRQLGFPTVNLDARGRLAPPPGVYAAITRVGSEFLASAAFVAPSEGASEYVGAVESHIIGRNMELYGREVEIIFVEYLRANRKFDTYDDLKQAIASDVRAAYTACSTVRI
ncbi:MAG: riboflavin biosynthesis protein RibF [Candidatus Brocadiia bacterium]